MAPSPIHQQISNFSSIHTKKAKKVGAWVYKLNTNEAVKHKCSAFKVKENITWSHRIVSKRKLRGFLIVTMWIWVLHEGGAEWKGLLIVQYFFYPLSFHFHEYISWHGKLHLHMVVLTVCKYFFCNTIYLYRLISVIFLTHLEAADNVLSTKCLCSRTHLIQFNSNPWNFPASSFYSLRFYGLIGFMWAQCFDWRSPREVSSVIGRNIDESVRSLLTARESMPYL